MATKKQKIRKAIIPAAGLGTRFLPATKAQPKEMLPIVDKPAIQFIVEEALASGIEEILVIIGRNKRSIEDHFDRSVELELPDPPPEPALPEPPVPDGAELPGPGLVGELAAVPSLLSEVSASVDVEGASSAAVSVVAESAVASASASPVSAPVAPSSVGSASSSAPSAASPAAWASSVVASAPDPETSASGSSPAR